MNKTTQERLIHRHNEKIDGVIKIGKQYSNIKLEYIKNNIKKIKFDFDQYTIKYLYEYFSYSSRGYNKRDLSYILIGTIIGEVSLHNGNESGHGSVSATQMIIKILEREAPLRAVLMKKWAYNFGFRNGFFA